MTNLPSRSRTARRLPACALFASLAVASLAAPSADATIFTVGAGGTCTHTTLQAALDTAAGSNGPDTIRIARTVSWTAQQVSTQTNDDVEIVGGWFACGSDAPTGKTTLSGAGGDARSVIALRGDAHFRLRNLIIRDGDQAGDDDGGGIHFLGSGIVEISDSDIVENEAEDGGGIYAQGTTTAAELIIGANVVVGSNVARRHGGGVVAQNLEMSMLEAGSVLFMNTAGANGGGLLVASGEFPSYGYIGSSGIGDLGPVYGNQAARGGGIAVLSGVDSQRTAQVQVFSRTANAPVRIRANSASQRGGGIDLQPDADGLDGDAPAIAQLRNVSIEENNAPVGAAINLANDDAGPPGLVSWTGGEVYFNRAGPTALHPAAASCPFGAPCGYIARNHTLDTIGAVVQLTNGSEFYSSRIAMQDNTGGWLMYVAGDYFTTLELDNSLVAGNTVQNALLRDDEPGDFLPLALHYLTITGNTIGANGVLSINEELALTRSLVDQPGKPLFATNVGSSGGARDVQHVLVNGFGDGPGTTAAAPRFVDPTEGDYMPRAGSVAVDIAPPLPNFPQDLYSHTRSIDLALNPNEFGASDAGALEREYLQPLLLNADFDADTRLWSGVSDSFWDGTQNIAGAAGSGSVRVPMPTVIEGKGANAKVVAGLAQCIHLPGPGTYRLNGWGRVVPTSNPPLVSSRAALIWELRNLGATHGCETGPADLSGVHPLSTTSTWTRPVNSAFITVPEALWTRTTAISVKFDVNGAPSNPPTAWFDGITLDVDQDLSTELFANGFE